jgi:multidrug efflux pump subunit AcrB
VYRHLQMGKSREKAAIDGASEVFMPVNAAILTSVAAFLPMLLMDGILGKFMMWIPLVVIFALIGSLVESFVILPSHLADFGLPKLVDKEKNREKGWFRILRGFYTWLLTKILRRRYIFVPCTILIAVLIVGFGFKTLGFKLFPDLNLDRFTLSVTAPVGVKLEETERVVREIEKQAENLPEEEWESILGRIGEAGRGAERSIASNIGEVTVTLVDADRRDRSGEEIIAAFRKSLEPGKGVKVEVVRGRTGPPTGPPVQIRIRGENLERLREVSAEIKSFLAAIEGVKDITSDDDTGKSEEHIVIDETQAKELGVDVLSVAETVRFAYGGGLATEILRGDEDIDVVVRLAPQFRRDVNDLMALNVRRDSGTLVPMENVVSIQPRRGPAQINRYNGKRCITVRADVESEVITSFAVNNQVREKYGASIGSEVFLSYSGEDEDRKKSMDSLMSAFWVAFILIYMILGALFRSFIQPLVVLFTIPLGLIGVIYGLFIHGQPMSLMAMIGVVALSGVVVNDSLVFVDFINRLRAAGVPRLQAIIRSGRHRLRPILLTTATTVVGLMPLMFEVTGSAAFLTPMAVSIVWGLLFATVLLLLFIPALYLIVDDVRRWAMGEKKPTSL